MINVKLLILVPEEGGRIDLLISINIGSGL